MICTFGDVTDVVWWRELSLPVRAILQPNGTLRPLTWGERGWEADDAGRRAAALRPARRALRRQGPRRDRRAASRERRSHGRAPADHARREVLREGRSAARDHHQPAVVHQDDGVPRSAAAARRGAAVAPALHAGAARELGQRAERRLVRQPAAFLRRAVSRLVQGARATARSITPRCSCPARSSCRSIRPPTCPTATRRTSGISREDSPAIRTSWTPGRRRR